MKRTIKALWILSAITILPFIYALAKFFNALESNESDWVLTIAFVGLICFAISFYCLWKGKSLQEQYFGVPVNAIIRTLLVMYTGIASLLCMILTIPFVFMLFGLVS